VAQIGTIWFRLGEVEPDTLRAFEGSKSDRFNCLRRAGRAARLPVPGAVLPLCPDEAGCLALTGI